MAPEIPEGSVHADAPVWLAQAQMVAPQAYPSAHWLPYGGGETVVLSIVLLVAAGGIAWTGKRLRAPFRVARPGGIAAAFMIAIWLLSIHAFVVALMVYGLQLAQAYPGFTPTGVKVGTLVDAPVACLAFLYLTRRWGWACALASAVIGPAAGWCIFEFPFDLIVMTRTNPPIPAHPMLYRQLLFLPLFLVEFSTVSLLTLLPSMRVTAHALYAVAAMFVTFAVWAAFGFAFPSDLLPRALNAIAKVMCFVAAVMLFVWKEDASDKGVSVQA